ncbi:unnamed protein product [Sphenostylis stenocarpa]|uniref:Uncharacterized protein n=1 Tax=Sphenostylis stenocarpa TaxID=92480 RepID=A0AA86S826_9FABA|nr:unnamed protein product [Sphenostylis stenocarpa]
MPATLTHVRNRHIKRGIGPPPNGVLNCTQINRTSIPLSSSERSMVQKPINVNSSDSEDDNKAQDKEEELDLPLANLNLGPRKKLPGELCGYLEGVGEGIDVESYVKDHPFGQPCNHIPHPVWTFYSQVKQCLGKKGNRRTMFLYS